LKKIKRVLVALATLALLLSLSGVAVSGVAAAKGGYKDAAPRPDTPNYNNGEPLPFGAGEKVNGQPPLGNAKVGTSRTWLALNDAQGRYYLKNYTLRGVGNHVEVWVANDLNFPAGDCRNDGVRNVITDGQVNYLIGQFDENMYPIEAEWWGTAPSRDGKHALLPTFFNGKKGNGGVNIPESNYKGEGDNIVVLVDNVRDDNYYDTNNANTKSYIAGFYSSALDDYFDRTVMSVDSWDWIHRTGADPEHDPTTDPCTSAPARPYLYEGTFAHEYQHLLHHYTDPAEVSWVNEGLSDFTEVITGYADISKHVNEKGYDGHTNCYLGWDSVYDADWNPIPRPCGPENSLTAWGDQGDDEILADYGFAMYFMNFLHSRGLDQDFFRSWQHNQGTGIAGLNAALADAGSSETFESLFNDEVVSALVDGYVDAGATGSGYQNSAANATINFSGDAYDTAGAPPWGADYLDLGAGASLTSVAFNGDDAYHYPGGNDYSVDPDGYFTNPDVGGDAPGFYGDEQDLSIARDVSGNDGKVLTFDTYYDLEANWDFAFVQVSTDNGASWQSLACTGTTSAHDPAAMGRIVAQLPGFTGTAGSAGSPVSVTCPALPVGTDLLAFRLMSDWATNYDGWHIKNIKLDGADVGTPGDLSDWDNLYYFSPLALDFGFTVVGLNGTVGTYGAVTGPASITVITTTPNADNEYTLTAGELAALSGFDKVVAIVWGIPGDEESTLYQQYSLLVNGIEKADGA
jgi:hypothetical protein